MLVSLDVGVWDRLTQILLSNPLPILPTFAPSFFFYFLAFSPSCPFFFPPFQPPPPFSLLPSLPSSLPSFLCQRSNYKIPVAQPILEIKVSKKKKKKENIHSTFKVIKQRRKPLLLSINFNFGPKNVLYLLCHWTDSSAKNSDKWIVL